MMTIDLDEIFEAMLLQHHVTRLEALLRNAGSVTPF
jgi:hypothetical protein